MNQITIRKYNPMLAMSLERAGAPTLLARLFAARGLQPEQLQRTQLAQLLPPSGMKGIDTAAQVIADALEANASILIIGDYDCDGATATAVAVRGLRMMLVAMNVSTSQAASLIQFLVPNRFEYGYGLSPEIVQVASERSPDLIITVDNGIASTEGVALANELGIGVVVTDHHLPGAALPDALAIVNPNQPGCTFESKHMAGVGVMFYVLLAVRAELRARGAWEPDKQPRLDGLLDLVALGTIADLVKLDANNRLLVAQGLQRIRAGRMQPGVAALLNVAGRDAKMISTTDIGFTIGPRLNAAGRLADMTIGIQALITDSMGDALEFARTLDAMNRDRQSIERGMKEQAEQQLEHLDVTDQPCIVVKNANWHQGVIGILASRIKEKFFRPTIVFAPSDDGQWKGSGRSIPGVHLRDVIDLATKRMPTGSVPKFGGHAMAAGLTVRADAIELFEQQFALAVADCVDANVLQKRLETDGSLPIEQYSNYTVDLIGQQVWGQGFPAPVFFDEFEIINQRLLKDVHSKLTVLRDGQQFTALWWGHADTVGGRLKMAYRIERDDFTGGGAVQLVVEGVGHL